MGNPSGGPSSVGIRNFWLAVLVVCAGLGLWSVVVFIIAHVWLIVVPVLVVGAGVAISRRGKQKAIAGKKRQQLY